MHKYTVVWFSLGAHGYHEVVGANARDALKQVRLLFNKELRMKAKWEVYQGTPLRGNPAYCMTHTTFA